MAATQQLFKQLFQLCASDIGGDSSFQRSGFAELCFPHYDLEDYHDGPVGDDNNVMSWIPRVQIIDEPNMKFTTKFILDAAQMHQIACYVLPRDLAFHRWKRLFSLARDGDSFQGCLKKIQGNVQTLLLVKTTRGEIFGGFSGSSWKPDNHEFHGSETTKLFSFATHTTTATTTTNTNTTSSNSSRRSRNNSSDDSDDANNQQHGETCDSRDDSEEKTDKKKPGQLSVYPWSGLNRDFQYCDPSRTLMAFGGGGARFGLSIEKDFQFGSTGPCDTFSNDKLGTDLNFRVLDVEIWGFVAVEDTCCSLLCFQQNHYKQESDVNWIPPVRVVRETTRPEKFVLDQTKMDLIARFVLPQTIAACRWKRVYSLGRDGDAFEACLYLTRKEKRSLMVIRTEDDQIFGGYADSPWRACNANYYGSAQACLWTFSKNIDKDGSSEQKIEPVDPNTIKVFKWTGINRYIQYCDVTHRILAFGGGGDAGSFGLCVEKEFQKGSTGPCATFGNDPLCNKEHFKILDLEIWGFVTGEF